MLALSKNRTTLIMDTTYFEDLRPVHTNCTVTRKRLVDLAHYCDHSRMELLVAGGEHIHVPNLDILLLLVLFE